jgi:hypothetical protein
MQYMKILSVSPNPTDGTSWYRCAGPLNRMERDYEDVNYIEMGSVDVSWDVLGKFDVLFLQRPHTMWHARLANKAIYMGLKVWVDFDDLLWDLPYMHRNYYDYNKPEVIKSIMAILNMNGRDCMITVSTQSLADQVKICKSTANVHVVPNGIDERIFGNKFEFAKNAQFMGWRGSDTHDIDLIYYMNDILDLHAKHKFNYIGYIPKDVGITFPDVEYTGPMNLLDYHAHLTTTRKWKAFYVCLHSNMFNFAKSNIAWLEATLAGALCIAPDWPEWRHPCITYSDHKGLRENMIKVMEHDTQTRMELWEQSKEVVVNNYTLGKQNQLRYELLKNHLNH